MNKLLIFGGYLINPFVGLVVTLKNLKNKENFVFGISLFLAFVGFYLVPTEKFDLYRYYEYFDNTVTLNKFEPFATRYFGMYILCYIIKILGINKHILPFISIFLYCYIFLSICNKQIDRNISEKQKLLLLFFAYIYGVGFTGITSGLRWSISTIFLIYSFKNYFDKKIKLKKLLLFLILGSVMHKASIILTGIFICSYFIKIPKFEKKIRFFLVVGIYLFTKYSLNMSTISNIYFKNLKKLPTHLAKSYSATSYLSTGKYGADSYEIKLLMSNFIGKLSLVLRNIFYFYAPYLYLIKKISFKEKISKMEYKFILLLMYFTVFVSNLGTIFGRSKIFLIIFIIFYILKNYKSKYYIIIQVITVIILFYKTFFGWRILTYIYLPTVLNMLKSIPLLDLLNIGSI